MAALVRAARSMRPAAPAVRRFSQAAAAASDLHRDGVAIAQRHITPGISRMTDLVVSRAEGSWLYTATGDKYLDFTCGIGVTNTGHCHPKVVAAVREQAGKLLHGQVNIVLHEPMLTLIERLLKIVPNGLDTFFFWNSGAEAVEAAIKLARHYTGKPNIIVFQGGYHGRTIGTMSLTTSKYIYRARYGPLMPGVFVSPFPYLRQMPPGVSQKQATAYCLEQFELLLHQQSSPAETACAIMEPVLGEGGYVEAPLEFLRGIRDICTRHGILLVADEVQTGFGRTGKMFAVEHYGVTPDILVMAKGLASGMPLSAIVSSREVCSKSPKGSQGGTYAGNAVSCAAALATLDVFEQEGLLSNANARSQQLREGLARMQRSGLPLAEVRGLGLMVGLEFDRRAPEGFAGKVAGECAKDRLLVLPTSAFECMRLIPPLNVSESECATALGVLEGAMARAAKAAGL